MDAARRRRRSPISRAAYCFGRSLMVGQEQSPPRVVVLLFARRKRQVADVRQRLIAAVRGNSPPLSVRGPVLRLNRVIIATRLSPADQIIQCLSVAIRYNQQPLMERREHTAGTG